MTFCSFDIISLIVQAVGGGKASTATTRKGANLVGFLTSSHDKIPIATSGRTYYACGNCVPARYGGNLLDNTLESGLLTGDIFQCLS